MPRRDDDPDRSLDLDAEGIPDLDAPLPGKVATGDPQEGPAPPRDHPVGATEYGTTPFEEAAGEPLGLRLSREEPELTEDEVLVAEDFERPIGRVYDETDDLSDGYVVDEEGELVGRAEDVDAATLSAEEAAVHEIREE
jgi:hypothetical protein